MIRYTKQPDGTFTKEGEVTTRYAIMRSCRNGVWKEPICPIPTKDLVYILDNEDPKYLPAEIYELLEEIISKPTEEKVNKIIKWRKTVEETVKEVVGVKELVTKIKTEKATKKNRTILTCSFEGCTNTYPRSKGRFPKPFCEEHNG